MSDIFNYTDCYEFCKEWVKKQMKPFTFEDVRSAWIMAGNPSAYDNNVFSHIAQRLSVSEAMTAHGYFKAKLPAARGRIITVWISREYRLKQQQNATGPKPLSLFS